MAPVDFCRGRLWTFRESIETPLPPVDWAIKDVLAAEERAVFYGSPGSMKTWCLLQLGFAVATGRPWLGHFAVPKPRPVLYVDWEMPEWGMRKRIERNAQGMGLTGDVLFGLLSRPILKLDREGAEELRRLLGAQEPWRARGPHLIIADSLRRCLVGSENDADAVARFWDAADVLVRDGHTLALSHHTRKAGVNGPGDPQERASGSTYIIGGADVAMCIERATKDTATVEMTKARSGPELEPFAFSLDAGAGPEDGPVTLRFEGFRRPSGERVTKAQQAKDLIRAFLKAQPEGKADAKAIHAHVTAQGIGKKTSENALAALAEGPPPEVRSVEHGVWELIAPAGAASTVRQEAA